MSLQYNTVKSYLVPEETPDKEDINNIIDRLRAIDYLGNDAKQMQLFDIYDVLFGKIRSARVSIDRSDSYGIGINVYYLIVPNIKLFLTFHRKMGKQIFVTLQGDTPYVDIIDPSGTLQKLLISRLPLDLRNVLMYYIYPPYKHDPVELESYIGPVILSEENTGIKVRTNFPSNWRLDNKWDAVSNLIFSVIEVLNHAERNYDITKYPITLSVKACKEMCREGEEAIVINKKFYRLPSIDLK